MSDAKIPDETVFVADNVDEFVERTRHTQILDAKERAADALREAQLRRMEARSKEKPSWLIKQAAREPARSAVESYILECESLYRQTEEGRELWHKADLSTIQVRDAMDLRHRDNIGKVKSIRIGGSGSGAKDPEITVTGVGGYLELSSTEICVEHEKALPRRGSPTEVDTFWCDLTIPVDVSREAYRATNVLLTALDLGVKTGEEDGVVDGDYSELLDKLDDNVNDE